MFPGHTRHCHVVQPPIDVDGGTRWTLGRVSQLLFDGRFQWRDPEHALPTLWRSQWRMGRSRRRKQCRNTFENCFLQPPLTRLDTAGLDVRLSDSVPTGSISGEAPTLFHGTCVTPFGRLLFLVHTVCSSRVASVSVLIKARHNRSLTWFCTVNGDQSKETIQTVVSIDCDYMSCHRHRHVNWQSVSGQLRCSWWNCPSSNRRACRRIQMNTKRWDEHAQRGRWLHSIVSSRTLPQTSSQVLWAFKDGVNGAGLDACLIHLEKAIAVSLFSTSRRRAGRRLDVSSAVLVAEAK